LGSARAKARAPSLHQFPIPEVVEYCAAPWLVFPPPLTRVARAPLTGRIFDVDGL
jgi:hypothetical protein